MENKDIENVIAHVNRIIDNLNQHWHSISLLLSHVSKPLLVDDRGLASCLRSFHKLMDKFLRELKESDIGQTLGEIKYIGKRLNDIENSLREIKGNGITKNIDLSFIVDGHQMVKKPVGYDPQEPIEKPNDSLDNLLNTLSTNEAQIIIHRYGLFGQKRKTYDEIGKIMGVTKEPIRQKIAKILRKLRHPTRRDLMNKITHAALRKEVLGE